MSSIKLVRLRSEAMLGGVCAGLGAYLRIDPSFVRLFFILLAFAEGVGVGVYLVLWLLLPRESVQEGQAMDATIRENASEMAERARNLGSEMSQGFDGAHPQLPMVIGGALVILGIAFLIDNLNLVWLAWFRLELLWPVLLILAGAVLLIRRTQGD
ncbi:MAG: PspC domain-containing protein [Anaerolineales bacterium]|nr:MAG: PspC domain-containing protein [Anaerolineales bacterium]